MLLSFWKLICSYYLFSFGKLPKLMLFLKKDINYRWEVCTCIKRFSKNMSWVLKWVLNDSFPHNFLVQNIKFNIGHGMDPTGLFVTVVSCFEWTLLGNFMDSFWMVSLVSRAYVPILTIYLYFPDLLFYHQVSLFCMIMFMVCFRCHGFPSVLYLYQKFKVEIRVKDFILHGFFFFFFFIMCLYTKIFRENLFESMWLYFFRRKTLIHWTVWGVKVVVNCGCCTWSHIIHTILHTVCTSILSLIDY